LFVNPPPIAIKVKHIRQPWQFQAEKNVVCSCMHPLLFGQAFIRRSIKPL